MRFFKYLIAMSCMIFFQSTFAYVTFYNHSRTDFLIVSYKICDPAPGNYGTFSCSLTVNETKKIPPMSAYKDEDITSNDPDFEIAVTSVKAILPDTSVFIKNISGYITGSNPSPCFAYGNTGVLLETFNNQQEVACSNTSA